MAKLTLVASSRVLAVLRGAARGRALSSLLPAITTTMTTEELATVLQLTNCCLTCSGISDTSINHNK
jgi:hypothetical protein